MARRCRQLKVKVAVEFVEIDDKDIIVTNGHAAFTEHVSSFLPAHKSEIGKHSSRLLSINTMECAML